jgi:hypothetical protein
MLLERGALEGLLFDRISLALIEVSNIDHMMIYVKDIITKKLEVIVSI